MCLIEVAEGNRRIREAPMLSALQLIDRPLEPSDSGKLLGADTDVLPEETSEMLTGPADLAGDGSDGRRSRSRQGGHCVGNRPVRWSDPRETRQ